MYFMFHFFLFPFGWPPWWFFVMQIGDEREWANKAGRTIFMENDLKNFIQAEKIVNPTTLKLLSSEFGLNVFP